MYPTFPFPLSVLFVTCEPFLGCDPPFENHCPTGKLPSQHSHVGPTWVWPGQSNLGPR